MSVVKGVLVKGRTETQGEGEERGKGKEGRGAPRTSTI